jgi:tetratricopeptide (TPR) repeat protein
VIGAVLGDPACQDKGCDLFVVPHSTQFADYVFAYYLTTDFPAASLPVHGLLDTAFSVTPFDFETLLNSQYVVYVNANMKGDSYGAALTRLLHSPPASFSNSHLPVKFLRLPDGSRVRLIKRISPLTLEEAKDVIDSIDLAQKYKSQQYEVMAALYSEAGQPDEALAAYERALLYARAPDAKLRFGLASAYASLGQDEKAAIEFQKVIEIDPNSDFARQARKWLSKHSG